MIRSLLASLLGTLFVLSLTSFAFAGTPCGGTYFQHGYRAVDKIRRNITSQSGSYVLDDWTGDGRSDFWNFRWNDATSTQDIVIYPASPGGYWNWDAPIIITTNFTTSATTQHGTGFSFFRVDHDSDGDMDILIFGGGLGGIRTTSIYRNTGTAILPGVQTQWPGADSDTVLGTIAYADITADGIADHLYLLVESSNGQRTITYSPGNSDGTFNAPVTVLTGTPENELNNSVLVSGDFDGDGKLDMAYRRNDGAAARIRVLKGVGNGTFSLGDPMTTETFDLKQVADYNSDGRQDFLAIRGNTFSIFYGQTDATFSSSQSFPYATLNSALLPIVDFNGDGRKDLIFVTNQDYEIHLRDPDGTYSRQYYMTRFPSISLYLHFEDFNNDGKADLFDENSDNRFFNSFGEEVAIVQENVCELSRIPSTANFDDRPRPDITVWNPASGDWKHGDADFNATGTIAVTTFNWGLGSHGDIPAPGDFDGDGKTDHTVYRPGEGNWYTYLTATNSWLVFRFGLAGDIPVPNDYDGGGKTDFAVFRPSDGNWYIWFVESGTFALIHWGANGDRPVPADFDGDHKTDIAVFRPSDGDWYFLRSSDSSYGIVHWGLNGDVPLPADYDGDKKADLAVYRSGVWYIWRTSNGGFAFVSWGTAGDVPIPAPQLAGMSRPAVYRPSNSRWYGYPYPIGYALLLSGTPIYYGLPNN